MRIFYQLSFCLVLLAAAQEVAAQNNVTINPRSREEVSTEPWRFRAGDSIGWASPRYADQHWIEMDPDADLNDNPGLWQAGRGWFRQTFRFRRLRGKDATLTVRQFGQSEIYIDGRRIARLVPAGYVSGGSQQLVVLVPVAIADTNLHTLAVRYAFRRDPIIGKLIDKQPFDLNFSANDHAISDLLTNERGSAARTYLMTGLFGLLSLLHWLFYRANPSQGINRILAVTMLAFALTFIDDQIDPFIGTLTLDSLRGTLSELFTNAAFGLLLLSVYTYLHRRPGPLFWVLIAVLIINGLYGIVSGQLLYSRVAYVLVVIEYVRVSWLAQRRRSDPDARLPWNSLKVSLYAFLAVIPVAIVVGFLFNVLHIEDRATDWLMVFVGVLSLIGLFSVPLGLSLSLVRDYARTYLSLRKKFEEVEQLSAQTLHQEQEKQQILARQNEMLENQVTKRTAELKRSLTELHETQAQLIQREKLASLGELTAGIAHEIQNPLNFVNNFSEVSSELVGELREEETKADRDPQLIDELLGDLAQNLQKITHHGHRASAIVRGMLEHSRSSTGERAPTDLNALADEYLRLAYQGLRAKDKTGSPEQDRFACELVTDFSPDLGLADVVPQEIGRVLLNLFNNAFYAVHQKQQTAPANYQPTVTVSTRQSEENMVEIRVRDNGTGIPDSVREKIFQPFFTTKPTGEGTGLGLSLSYDIVTKGHGGMITVESTVGEGTTFVVGLPLLPTS